MPLRTLFLVDMMYVVLFSELNAQAARVLLALVIPGHLIFMYTICCSIFRIKCSSSPSSPSSSHSWSSYIYVYYIVYESWSHKYNSNIYSNVLNSSIITSKSFQVCYQ